MAGFTVSTVAFVAVVAAVVVTVTHVAGWDAHSTRWTLELIGTTRCIAPSVTVDYRWSVSKTKINSDSFQ